MIGLINAYYFSESEEYQKKYSSLYLNYMQQTLPRNEIKMYNVAFGDWPKSPKDCEAWVISGSSKGSYETTPWILQLAEFIKTCAAKEIKMVGICFGHQLIAHALGGKTIKHDKGWGVGVHNFNIKQSASWMKPQKSTCSLLFSHQDQVVKLPPDSLHLAENDFCKYQMYSIKNYIFSMQGHPEFSPEFARDRLDTRRKIIGEKIYDQAIKTLDHKTDSELMGQWICNFLKE